VVSLLPNPIIAIPLWRVFGVDTSVTMAVAKLTFPLASPPTIRANTKMAKVDEKHLKIWKIGSLQSIFNYIFHVYF
jgi:hypothetical protein